MRSIRGFRTIHWILMVSLGFILNPSFQERPIFELIFPALAVAFLWQYTTMINDIHDIKIDKKAHPDRPLVTKTVSIEDYRRMAHISLVLAMFLSFISGPFVILLNLIAVLLAIAYSMPPLRIRDKWYGTAIMGAGSVTQIMAGYHSNFWIFDMSFFETSVPTEMYVKILFIAFMALSIAPNITAYRDYEGDRDAGVSTIYTILGKEHGKNLVSVLTLMLFILPELLFPSISMAILCLSLGVLAYISFKIYECIPCIFILYFTELLYFLIYLL